MALIKMGNGIRTMNMSSINPDSVKEEQTQRDIIKNLTRRKIHIAAIQETHIAHDRDYIMGNYRVVTAAGNKREDISTTWGEQQ